MEELIQLILTAAVSIIASVIGSTGFWALMQKKAEKKDEDSHKNSAASKMLRGLGHEKIMERGMSYIERGWVTRSEYEDLLSYLYEPYQELGGNGSAEKIMNEVKKLPIHPDGYREEDDSDEISN